MAKKRTISRRDLREQNDAAEARAKDDDKEEVEETPEEEPADDDEGEEDEDGKPKKKKAKPKVKKVPAVKKPSAPKKARVPKEERMKAVWVVFDNGSKRVDTFPFSQKSDAEALLAKKLEEKKGWYFLTMVKEKMD